MTKTYTISTYADKATYTVTLDDTGILSAEGISEGATDELRDSVARLMKRYNLAPVTALDRVIGSYSTVSEVAASSVTGEPTGDVVS